MTRPVVRLDAATVTVEASTILADVDLTLEAGEHLAVLGPNGSGKTTLLRLLAGRLHPTSGSVEVLGERFGRTDLRQLWARVAFVSTALDRLLVRTAPAVAVVAAGRVGATLPTPDHLADQAARPAAEAALARVGVSHLADRRADTLSQGEWQRVRIAAGLVREPHLLLLDEPFAGLDLAGRESLLADVDRLLQDAGGGAPTVVLVTHHLEEVPTAVDRALLLRGGRVVATGATSDVLTSSAVSDAFALPVTVTTVDGRYAARATTPS